ncbi:NYN domain-containing protein [Pseudoalteromonas ruthenica]|uniref:LabA-like NYN domain-containing protein n=1 Tax=Pseudoalteromonas ruthenica TaxID=151081 RepID=UPI0012470FE7|nr:NYN domain-containing protein [Pseudoalteromonas ruthenica]|tara:strand:- start:43173 stop:43649 length:477 start_codon:yes stop_codon:yes gene_type:complete
MPTAAIFVDVQNIYYTCRESFARNFDYNAFWREVSAKYEIVTAIAYAIDRGDSKQREFQNILRAIGFEVKLKPYIQRADGSAKGDWDVGITLDAMEYGTQTDTTILLSGDGDFDMLVAKLRHECNKRVEVYSCAPLTATSLINAASHFRAIDDTLLLG